MANIPKVMDSYESKTITTNKTFRDDGKDPILAWGVDEHLRIGRGFDAVDILMRLARNPCRKGSDISYCKCKIPCRLDDYKKMKRSGEDIDANFSNKFENLMNKVLESQPSCFQSEVSHPLRHSPLCEGYKIPKTMKYASAGILGSTLNWLVSFLYRKKDNIPPGPVDFFFENGAYKKFIDAVVVDLKMIELLQVEEEIGSYQARFQMVVSWYDASFDTTQWRHPKYKQYRVTSYRTPKIRFLDVLEGSKGWYDHNNVSEVTLGDPVQLPGVVFKTLNFACTVRDDNPIKWFPFDRQELTMEMELPGSVSRDDKDHGRYFIPLNCSVANKHDMLTWNYHEPRVHITRPRGLKSHMVCMFRITRRPWNFVVNVMLVMGLLASLAGISFVVPIQDVSDRSAVTLTLLLTAVAFKQVLSQTLPKVAYLTYLDIYVLCCFFGIFLVAVENAMAAFYTGVEGTVSCGQSEFTGNERDDCYWEIDGNDTLIPARSRLGSGGSYHIFDVLYAEKWFQIILGLAWVAFHVFVGLIAFHQAKKNIMLFGRELVASNTDKESHHKYGINMTMKKTRGRIQTTFSIMDVSSTHAVGGIKCICAGCSSRYPRHTDLDDGDAEEATKSFDEKALECVVSEAGMALEASSLVPALISAGLSVERLCDFDTELINEILEAHNVNLQSRLEMVVAARQQVLLCFLLGASSYMMMALKLDGMMVTKGKILRAIDKQLENPSHTNPVKVSWTNFSNFMYTRVLLNSSAVPSVYVLSQRTCRSQNSLLYTQLFAGFGASLTKDLRDNERRNVVIIDIGSGQIKRFICKIGKNVPLQLLHEHKDPEAEAQRGAAAYGEALKTMLTNLLAHYNSKDTLKEPPETIIKAPLDSATKAIVGNLVEFMQADKQNVVLDAYVLATASTRKYFSEQNSKAERLAKQYIITVLEKSLQDALKLKTQFSILSQAHEAEFEFRAARAAITHAIDIPLEAQAIGPDSLSSVSWGKGSTQGYNRGLKDQDNGRIAETPLTLQIGLTKVQEFAKEWMTRNEGSCSTSVQEVGKSKDIVFVDEGELEDMCNFVCSMIRAELNKDPSQTLRFYSSQEDAFESGGSSI
eukprot:m.72377 g.72377  ORF g.72377 m.72377 type:complete len:1093 (+) comp12321_c0_seq1:202-3480(+)